MKIDNLILIIVAVIAAFWTVVIVLALVGILNESVMLGG